MSAEPKCPCGCTEFRQNLFKEHACSNCLHVHNVELRKFAGTRPAPRVRIDSLPHNTPLAEQLHLVRSPRESDASLRVKVVGEILDSEKSFIYQLGLLESYRKLISDANVLPDETVELIFYGIGSIVELHKSFVILIQERLDSTAHHKVKLGDIFTRICPFLKCHMAYATKHEEGNETLLELEKNKKFLSLLDEFPVRAYSGLNGLTSLRISPVQRIPRYNLLLRDLMKYTPKDDDDYQQLQVAVEKFIGLGEEVNKALHSYQDSVRIQKLDAKLTGKREELLDSGNMVQLRHHWSTKKRATTPSVCEWCHSLIFPGRSYMSCSSCGNHVHARQCSTKVSPFCVKPTLMAQGRTFLKEFTDIKYRNANKSKRMRAASMVLFNDSIFIYYNSVVGPQLASMIRWKSKTTGKNIQVSTCPGNKIVVTAPRTGDQIYLLVEEDHEKAAMLDAINSAIADWNEEQAEKATRHFPLRSHSTVTLSDQNITGDIRFRIPSSQVIYESTGEMHMGYIVEVIEGHSTSVILKRYEDFIALHTQLRRCCSRHRLPKLPSKMLLKDSKNNEYYAQRRCRGLEQYLNEVGAQKEVVELPVFQSFVRTSQINCRPDDDVVSTWRDDELSDESYEDFSDEVNFEEDCSGEGVEAEALWEFVPVVDLGADASEKGLLVHKGDVVQVLNEDSDEWWYCRHSRNGREGFVPSCYLQKMTDQGGSSSSAHRD